MKRLSLFARLLIDPAGALAEIKEAHHYVTGILLATVAAVLYGSHASGVFRDLKFLLLGQSRAGTLALVIWGVLPAIFRELAPLVLFAGILVPIGITIVNSLDPRGTLGVVLRNEYRGMLACVTYAWAAAHLLLSVPAFLLFDSRNPLYEIALFLAPLPYFALLVMISFRDGMHLPARRAVLTTLVSFVSIPLLLLGTTLLFSIFPFFFLLWFVILMRGYLSEIFAAQRTRARFRANLEAATINPADASAHYDLGLIYQQQGDIEESIQSFQQAVEIDPNEIDAAYRLGRIRREQGRYSDAIALFDHVVRRKVDHAQNEVWREIGCTYHGAGQYEDAREAFERFLSTRPSDAEGKYRYGLTLFKLGRIQEARGEMRGVIETVKMSPAYKYRTERLWMIEAQAFLRSQST